MGKTYILKPEIQEISFCLIFVVYHNILVDKRTLRFLLIQKVGKRSKIDQETLLFSLFE